MSEEPKVHNVHESSENHHTPITQSTQKLSATASTERDIKRYKKFMIIGIIVSIVLLIIAAAFGSYWLVYRTSKEYTVKTFLKETLPFPVAYVNSDAVSLNEFESQIQSAEYYFDKQEELGTSEQVQKPVMSELRTQILNDLIDRTLLEHVAAERAISISNNDIDDYFEKEIVPQATGGKEEITSTLKEMYNWTIDDFKQQVVYEVVLRKKVGESIAEDKTIDEQKKKEAEMLREEILAATDKQFSDFAKEQSDDTVSGADGGMLGYFGKGEMVPEFEEAVFALNVGDVSAPVKTQFGYHLIKVTNKDEAAEKVEARHILLAFPTVDELIADAEQAAKIRTYMPIYAD